jgi:predicted permease
MAAWRQDLMYAFRRLSKSPGFAAAAVVSIGLGIAANSTIFSMVSTFLLRPAPVGDPATLMAVFTTQRNECCNDTISWLLFKDLGSQISSFSSVAGYYAFMPASISGNGEPERVWGQPATTNFFDVAQLHMELGRGFTSDEDRLPVIVLGHALWQRRFGGDPNIAGKSISLSGRPFTVVGVAPPSFHGLDLIINSEFWVPLRNIDQLLPKTAKFDSRDYNWLTATARLKPGVTRTQAAAELSVLAQRLAKDYPQAENGRAFRLELTGALQPGWKSQATMFLGGLTVVVLLVLCIACANVANLLLAQASARQREMAVRLALGATRGQLLRQMLTESLLLALCGGLLGVTLSLWATQALSTFHLPVPVPLDIAVGVDWSVLLYTFALSFGTALLFGLAPALAASRPIISSALKGEDVLARPGRRWTLRNVLVVSQIAMSLVLLCATGLFLRSLQSAARIDVGFRSRDVLMVSVDPQMHGYTGARTVQFLTQLRQRVSTLPGVAAATCTDLAPLSMGGRRDGFHAENHPKSSAPDPGIDLYMVAPGYFDTLGIARIAGRDFAAETAASPRVAVVNETFAHKVFPNENPLGQRVSGGGSTYEIIGVVKNTKSRTLGEDLRPVLYRSIAQEMGREASFMGYSLLVHYQGDPAALATAVRHEIAALDPTMAVFNAETMQDHLHNALFLPRLAGTLFGVFGFVGLLLAAVGLYGVMSYSVSRRTREIGIRVALGAQIGGVQRLIVRQGMLLALIAVAVGLSAALAVAKLSASLLYGVHPYDLLTFTAAPLFLAAVALLACWIPSRRASRVDPLTALRYE